MADSKKDKIKYSLLKIIDISGFKVLDPPVRLIFGEEPRKQLQDIGKYMFLPILFCGCCILFWHIIAPLHKTKSGAVPTPIRVVDSAKENLRYQERENEKLDDFYATGQERLDRLKEAEESLAEFQEKAENRQKESKKISEEGKKNIDKLLKPYQDALAELKAKQKVAKTALDEEILALSAKVTAKEASIDDLLALSKKASDIKTSDREAQQGINDKMKEIRDNPPEEIEQAKFAANNMEDEVQHYKKRIAILTKENREVTGEVLEEKIVTTKSELTSEEDPKKAIKTASKITTLESNLVKNEVKKKAKGSTIFWQTKRSILTVFVGFVLAAAIAIPIGIMCGLNKIVMACLTPIISIFRPVSPVVWLLIFQIIVGAFFLPDPANHPLFVSLNNETWLGFIPNPISSLKADPAMIFSACTVAMCALWPALVNTALGVSAVDKDHMNVARVLKLGFWSRLFKIVIPASLPLVFAGLRISLGVGWMVLIAAEALSGSEGLGKFVWDEFQNGSSKSFANIFLACFIVGFIGFFLDRIMIVLQRLVSFDDGSATA